MIFGPRNRFALEPIAKTLLPGDDIAAADAARIAALEIAGIVETDPRRKMQAEGDDLVPFPSRVGRRLRLAGHGLAEERFLAFLAQLVLRPRERRSPGELADIGHAQAHADETAAVTRPHTHADDVGVG